MSYSTLSKPLLFESQLKYRLGLAKQRLHRYPVDGMNFIMMDLERPDLRHRHAHWCSYDLTGRLLFFYTRAEGIDGEHIAELKELYERIMHNRRKSGVFGRSYEFQGKLPEDALHIGTQFVSGLVEYYVLTGDMRALNAARDCADYLMSKGEAFYNNMINPAGPNKLEAWITEGFADLYRETGDKKYVEAIRHIAFHCVGSMQGAHSHGYLTTLRGILKAGVLARDEELIQFVKERRQDILDKGCVYPNGDISEAFPRVSARNEGCSIADWIMLNLLYAHYFGEDEAYEMVEHSLWNALYFNQFVTGGFGHRYFGKNGYRTYIEEAWWCCTQNCGMALSEVARHVVTMKDGRLKLNFFIPGEYTVPTEKGEITVTVTTNYPTKAETIVKVTGTKEDLAIRVPGFIKGYTCRRVETDFGYTLYLNGRMGHYVEQRGQRYVVKYGPLVIAPMIYHWDAIMAPEEENTVPDGYCHEAFSGTNCKLVLPKPDADGFYHWEHDPLPEWVVFEEGEMAGISGGEAATAHVPVIFPNGKKTEVLFQPLCSATSNLTLMDIVSDFALAD